MLLKSCRTCCDFCRFSRPTATSFTIPSQNLLSLTPVVHRLSVGNPPKTENIPCPSRAGGNFTQTVHHQHGRSNGGMPRSRWNDAVTTALRHGRTCRWNDFPTSGNHRKFPPWPHVVEPPRLPWPPSTASHWPWGDGQPRHGRSCPRRGFE